MYITESCARQAQVVLILKRHDFADAIDGWTADGLHRDGFVCLSLGIEPSPTK